MSPSLPDLEKFDSTLKKSLPCLSKFFFLTPCLLEFQNFFSTLNQLCKSWIIIGQFKNVNIVLLFSIVFQMTQNSMLLPPWPRWELLLTKLVSWDQGIHCRILFFCFDIYIGDKCIDFTIHDFTKIPFFLLYKLPSITIHPLLEDAPKLIKLQ